MDIILASTSAYRRKLLSRLLTQFECINPGVDETPAPQEKPAKLARRLALAKARVVADMRPHALVIGGDQVATLQNLRLDKPGNPGAAVEQLMRSSGQCVTFYTAVAVIVQAQKFERTHSATTAVYFRDLCKAEIEDYVRKEQPYDCAGSFKAEGLGIALFEAVKGADPTALEGLPLIGLTALLAAAGHPVL